MPEARAVGVLSCNWAMFVDNKLLKGVLHLKRSCVCVYVNRDKPYLLAF